MQHIYVPASIAQKIRDEYGERIICILNNSITIQCAIRPYGEGNYVIHINKQICKKLQLAQGTPVNCAIEPDTSEYGLPVPEEFAAVLEADPQAAALFEALTPGRKRTLLYLAGSVKNSDKRIYRSLKILQHLVEMNGKVDFKKLNNDIKNAIV
jgi:hypothetical protein